MAKRCQVYVNQRWRERAAVDIDAGDIFRIVGEDGKLVEDENGSTRWRAMSRGSVDADGDLAIEMEPMPLTGVESEVERDGHWWPGRVGERNPGLGRLSGR